MIITLLDALSAGTRTNLLCISFNLSLRYFAVTLGLLGKR